MNRFQKFFYGTVSCRVQTQGSERFFNICHAQNITLYGIHTQNEFTYFFVSINNFKNLKHISRKSHIIPHITNKFGLPFILYRHTHKLIFLISLLIAIFFLIYLSGFIWNIEFEGNIKYSEDTLIKALNELQIYTGQRKTHINTDNLEEELRLKYDNIAWVSATVDGTVLKIYLKEALITNSNEEKSNHGNMISNTDCTIESIVTRSGTPRVIKGETVQAGDLLIEGKVTLYNDDQTIKEEHGVCPDGDIYGRYILTYNDYYPKWMMDKSKTTHTTYGLSVKLFNHKINIGDHTQKKENCIQTAENIHYRMTPNFYLPFQITVYTNRYYEPQKIYYSDEYVRLIGKKRIENIETNLKENKAIIHKNTIEITTDEEYYCIIGEIEITGPIGEFSACK